MRLLASTLLVLSLLLGADTSDSAPLPGPDLSGTWKQTVTVTTAAQVPVLGQIQIVSEKVNLVRITRGSDGEWVQQQLSCSIDASTTAMVTTVFPPAFIASLPVKTCPVQVWEEGGLWHYEADLVADYVGFEPGSAVPDSADAPNLVDGDRDGNPAVTVQLVVPVFGQVDAYLVQQAHAYLVDGVIDGDRITGQTVVRDMESRVVGSSSPLFARQPVVSPVPGASSFVMERVPTGSSCADL